jgi:hypothetical protein
MNSETFEQFYEHHEQFKIRMSDKANRYLALLLCSDPDQTLKTVIRRLYFDEEIYSETPPELALRKELEAAWNPAHYPALADFLTSPAGARGCQLLKISPQIVGLANNLIVVGNWLEEVALILHDPAHTQYPQEHHYLETLFSQQKDHFQALFNQLKVALAKL